MHSTGISVLGIVIRFLLGGGAVAASFVLARIIGGRWGGIFAAFPAVYMAAIITVGTGVPEGEGVNLTIQVSRGALVGMVANIACAVSAVFFIPGMGWKKGLAGALAVWLLFVTVVYEAVFRTGLVR